ncbi:Pentatricopeptide repeat-containing protein [Apostasia shenzhenica]|uniref:Pentatricopeptide repeat-containing protein n=1 Tax=Apostasia shenzhenica TaxID=1088818 RepID=A0A2H9ZSF1_9ASPA|nr:Pentatricopeptide repeat-containing protein [Apostasia shenzhenica]
MLPARLLLRRYRWQKLSPFSLPPDPQIYADLLISHSKQATHTRLHEAPRRAQTCRNCSVIHARILRLDLRLSDKLGNALIDLYSKSGDAELAQKAFNSIGAPDQVSWNSVLSAHLRGGCNDTVLSCFASMLRGGVSPDQFSFATALSACARLSLLYESMGLHCSLMKVGLSSNAYCAGSLIDAYAKCGQIIDARQMFDEIHEPDIITWTNMIAGYDRGGEAEEALKLFSSLCESGVELDRVSLVAAMTASLRLGMLEEAMGIFKQIESPNVVAWNAIISGHAQNGHEAESLGLFCEMRRSGLRPTRSTMGSVLSAAANLAAFGEGCQVHSEAIQLGLASNVFVRSSLINMYAKCGCMEEARRVLDSSEEKNVVMWNAMLGGMLQNGLAEDVMEVFAEMKRFDFEPDEVSYVSVLGASACLEDLHVGRQFHALVIKRSMASNIFLGNSLIDMYAKCGELSDARQQFELVPDRDIVSWNAIIVGNIYNNGEVEALKMFQRMRLEDVIPDQVSFSSVISACSSLGAFEEGKQMHCLSIKANFSSNPSVGSSLIDLYAKLGELEDAKLAYFKLPERNLPSRNALISGLVQKNEVEQAIILFKEMQLEGILPSSITFGSILPACGGIWGLSMGKQLHSFMFKSGLLQINELLNASLMEMYLRSKVPEDANKLFLEMPKSKSLVIWTLIISAHSQNDYHEEALLFFQEMRKYDIRFDESILASALGACTAIAALIEGKKIHSLVFRSAFHSYKYTSIQLLDMYSKCGDVGSSLLVFEEIKHKDDVTLWNSMIVGFAKNGYAQEALHLFHQLQQSKINPDDITFLGVLTACSHAGLTSKGRGFFELMKRKYGLYPRVHHYACMIDLLGRGGYLEKAEELIGNLPFEADGSIWGTMLAACRMHGDSERGELAAENLIKLEPYNSSPYMLLSGIYASSGNWAGAKRLRNEMRERGVKKLPGCSWIQVGNRTSLFVAGDKFHPDSNEIDATLNNLNWFMRDYGYSADLVSL